MHNVWESKDHDDGNDGGEGSGEVDNRIEID